VPELLGSAKLVKIETINLYFLRLYKEKKKFKNKKKGDHHSGVNVELSNFHFKEYRICILILRSIHK